MSRRDLSTSKKAMLAVVVLAALLAVGATGGLPPPHTDRPALSLSAHAFVQEGVLEIEANVDELALERAFGCRISLSAENAAPVKSVEVRPLPEKGAAKVKFSKAEVPPGRIVVSGVLLDATGRQIASAREILDSPLKPPWLGDPIGVSDQVMAPWTPLVVQHNRIKPWGRSYCFTECLLPREVITRDASVLASPVVLRVVAGGRDLPWSGAPPKVEFARPDLVKLSGSAQNEAFVLKASAEVDYDGMIRVDLELAPRSTAGIDELVVEIPLKPEHSRYLYHFPGKWRTVENAGYLPEDGWTHAFKPFVWLGDEERGFCWFCESDRDWLPYDRADAIAVEREEGRNVLSLRLIKDTEISRPLRYTFGFQATPVKRPEKDVWDYRICHMGSYDLPTRPDVRPGFIEYPAEGNIRGERGTFEAWVSLVQDSDPATVPRTASECPNEHILWVSFPDDEGTRGSNCGIFWVGPAQAVRVWVREDSEVLFTADAPVKWKKGEPHHVAVTWGDAVSIYVDGKLRCSRPRKGLTEKSVRGARLFVGGKWGAPCEVDEVRISDIDRAPDLSAQPYEVDVHTLLLGHLDELTTAGPSRTTRPAKSAGGMPGRLGPGPRLVSGKHGKAVELSGRNLLLDRLAEAGVRTICFHSHWSCAGHPVTPAGREQDLRQLVQACHARGIQLLLYHSWLVPDEAPEYGLYGEDILTTPRSFADIYRPGHVSYAACWCSHWREFCLTHMAKLIDEFDVDGFYLDGDEWAIACKNPHHGCGYLRPDGTRAPVYNIFATRQFMKRLYVICRTRKPDAQINIHNSTVMLIPTLGWGTSSWDGEQLGMLSWEGAGAAERVSRILDVLPLDAFRAEFMGRQWGVPSEFLCYEQPYTTSEALSITLLHGVLVRPNNAGQHLEVMSKLWRLADSFGLKQATWYPYWNNRGIVRSSVAAVKVSVYSRAEKGALLVVSNLGEQPATGELAISLDALKLPSSGLEAVDVMMEERHSLRGDNLSFSLEPLHYKLIWIRQLQANK